MKSIFNFILLSAIAISFTNCSNEKSEQEKTDSANANPTIQKTTLQTDSGNYEIEKVKGSDEGKGVLTDKNGNTQKGMIIDNKPVGAWVKYDAQGNVISAEHFENGKPMHVLDKNDFDFRTYENKQLNAKFLVPKNWKELPSPNAALLASFEKEDVDSSVHYKPNFNIARAQLSPGDSLGKMAQMQIDMMHQNFGHVDIVNENYIVIDSTLAFRRYGMYLVENNKVGFLNVIIVKGNTAWFFSCEAQNKADGEFLKYQGVFQQIVESFQTMN